MRCWRTGIQRNFSRYLDGELNSGEINRIEAHLMDCGWCRARLARLRDGHRFAQMAPRVRPRSEGWLALEATLDRDHTQAATDEIMRPQLQAWQRWFISRPRLAMPLMVIMLSILGGLILSAWLFWPVQREEFAGPIGVLDIDDFHAVTIADIEHNTKPHVVAEGYVSEVRIDEDGDLMFRLVDDLQQPAPFIVCEIINPIRLEAPPVGSRVRVYGVSRYDGQEGRQWHEVHPVLSIEMVRR